MYHGQNSTKIIPLSRWAVLRAVLDPGAKGRVITMGLAGGHCSIIWIRLMLMLFHHPPARLRQSALPPQS
jgi:hypothetical protein